MWIVFNFTKMQIQQNISLKPFHTFGIDVLAKYFAAFSTLEELQEVMEHFKSFEKPKLILGGGSNILFIKNFDGVVLKNELNGIELIKQDENYYYVKAAAGENWHGFVQYCIQNNYAGIENLSLIPGCVGASPMQNIGAYGIEIKDVFEELSAYHLHDKKIVNFSLSDCDFGYRESIFKKKYKNEFVILNVTFRLNKKPVYNISYGAIEDELKKMNVKELSIQAISRAVINIRRSKLPDPKIVGNAGSFFKNPTVIAEDVNSLKKVFPAMPTYKLASAQYLKIAAGWLIEQCGWKGFRDGDAGCSPTQALVLVNYGNAAGEEIFTLSEKIIDSVQAKFGITLEREVNII